MGADGGLCWLSLKKKYDNKESYDRVCYLLFPLIELHQNWRDEDNDYFDMIPSYSIISRYGTDLPDEEPLEALMIFLKYGDDNFEKIQELTFEELAYDLACRPDYEMYNLSFIERQVLNLCDDRDSYWYYSQNKKIPYQPRSERICNHVMKLEHLRDIKISDWFRDLKKIIWNHNSVETWT